MYDELSRFVHPVHTTNVCKQETFTFLVANSVTAKEVFLQEWFKLRHCNVCDALHTQQFTPCIARAERDGTRAETRFLLSLKRTSPFKSVGASVQSTAGSRGVRISLSNAG